MFSQVCIEPEVHIPGEKEEFVCCSLRVGESRDQLRCSTFSRIIKAAIMLVPSRRFGCRFVGTDSGE